MPARIFRSDVLPAPLPPMTPILAPKKNARVTLSRTMFLSYCLVRLRRVKTYSPATEDLL